ncbi:F0F1 ATP synthase subunit delta [Aneurinibacillus terranovensis]|uniref:F0F1 ATP synthase subunit delta n=1 Tax=Aneurinibacillus terranovensis TaxID=278991 RepID=UPI00040B57CA|nr:F0F1 ATP synthase subunit delta [Aneurinibacillus terranovensis]
MSAVAKRYARALFEVASEHKSIDATEQELAEITAIIKDNADLRKLLTHPKISADEKKQLMNSLFAGKISETTNKFINLLIERGRENDLTEMANYFTELSNEVRGIADATVITAKPLTQEEVNQLAESFGRKLNKTLRVKAEIDPSIIGGIIVRIGDRLYDGSMKGKLARFTQQIKQSQV